MLTIVFESGCLLTAGLHVVQNVKTLDVELTPDTNEHPVSSKSDAISTTVKFGHLIVVCTSTKFGQG